MRPIAIATLVLCLCAPACSLRRLTADSTADLLHAGSPQFNTLEDVDFAEASAPANLVTIESVWRVAPDNEDVLVELVQGYAAYGYAFMEDRMERARAADDEAAEAQFRARAQAAYRRARTFGLLLMNERAHTDGGPDAVKARGLDAWRAYLQRFRLRDDVPALFWTANAWASLVSLSTDDTDALLDLPFVLAVAERARAIDPDFENGSVHAFFGAWYASMAPSLGGQPQRAHEAFEAALRVSQRHMLTWHVLYARTYAVQVQDRALYERLLREVIDAGDVMPAQRLANQIAKRRAMRYLAEADTLFAPAEPPTP